MWRWIGCIANFSITWQVICLTHLIPEWNTTHGTQWLVWVCLLWLMWNRWLVNSVPSSTTFFLSNIPFQYRRVLSRIHHVTAAVETFSSPSTLRQAISTGVTIYDRRSRNHLKDAHLERYQLATAGFTFTVGLTDDAETQQKIEQEAKTYGDIIQIGVADFYRNLSLKVAGFCAKVDFVMKVDDDVYVNVRNLAHFVHDYYYQSNLSMFGISLPNNPFVPQRGRLYIYCFYQHLWLYSVALWSYHHFWFIDLYIGFSLYICFCFFVFCYMLWYQKANGALQSRNGRGITIRHIYLDRLCSCTVAQSFGYWQLFRQRQWLASMTCTTPAFAPKKLASRCTILQIRPAIIGLLIHFISMCYCWFLAVCFSSDY